MKNNYKLKFSPWLFVLCIAATLLCAYASVNSAFNFFRLTIVSERFSAAFFAIFNAMILITVLFYLLRSGYSLKDQAVFIRTAYFSDRISYKDIKKIHYFVSEEQLFLETLLDEDYVKINISSAEISSFVKALREKIPAVPYEISLKMDAEE